MLLTTHDINLLNEDFIRRDTIWFTDKDELDETKIVRLSSLRLTRIFPHTMLTSRENIVGEQRYDFGLRLLGVNISDNTGLVLYILSVLDALLELYNLDSVFANLERLFVSPKILNNTPIPPNKSQYIVILQ